MKKSFLVFLSILIVIGFLLYSLIFMPLPRASVKGPQASFKVIEGSVEVFSMRNNKIVGLLGVVRAGRTLVAPTLSAEKAEVPFLLQWVEPVLTEALGRANYYMFKYGEKYPSSEFTVVYQNRLLREEFLRALEKNPLIKYPSLEFSENGFSISGKVGGVDMSAQGVGDVSATAGYTPFVRLKWVRMGAFYLPEHNLRALEDLFTKSYIRSKKYGAKLIRVTYLDQSVVLTFRKEAGYNTGGLLSSFSSRVPEF